ncbi:MAG TPA: DnaJ domain-containing protein [bacterium]|nr:DnaJ domain-containing protein [bacterium]
MNEVNISFFGDLEQFSARNLFISLQAQRETGALYLQHERITKKIYFLNGQPVLALSTAPRDHLPRQLYRENRLSLEQIEAAAAQQRQTGKDIESILVDLKIVSPEELIVIRKKIIHTILLDAVRWSAGQYYFRFDADYPLWVGAHLEPFDTFDLIRNGLSRGLSDKWLRSYFRNRINRVPRLAQDAAVVRERLGLSEEQKSVLWTIDGERNLEKIILGSPLPIDQTHVLLLTLETLRIMHYDTDDLEDDEEGREYDTSEWGVEEMGLIQRLQERGPELLRKTPFELLGVTRSFNEEELRKGYYTIAQNFHKKEIVDHLPKELRKMSNDIFERASRVFEALVIWEKKRINGDFERFDDIDDEFLMNPRFPNLSAEIAFLKGVKHVLEKHNDEATDSLADARSLDPSISEYRAWHAWCIFNGSLNVDEKTNRNALVELRKAAHDDSGSIEIAKLYAHALEQSSRLEEAGQYYRNVLIRSPQDREALEGVKRCRKPLLRKDIDSIDAADQIDSDEEQRLKDEIVKMEQGDYFQLFGLDRNASDQAIRRRYFELAKEYHPDRFKNTRLLETAEQIFVLINEAYDVLTSKNKRRLYERSLRAVESQKSQLDIEKNISDRHLLQKGKSFIQSNNWNKACDLFARAINERKIKDPRFQLYNTWAIYNRDSRSNPNIRNETDVSFRKAIEELPDLPDAFLLYGKFLRRQEQYAKAKQNFERVLELDQHNVDALRELRLITQRIKTTGEVTVTQTTKSPKEKETKTEKKGLFGSIFGKKNN